MESRKAPRLVVNVGFAPHLLSKTLTFKFMSVFRPTQALDEAEQSVSFVMQPEALRTFAEALLGYADYLDGKSADHPANQLH